MKAARRSYNKDKTNVYKRQSYHYARALFRREKSKANQKFNEDYADSIDFTTQPKQAWKALKSLVSPGVQGILFNLSLYLHLYCGLCFQG